MFCNQCGTQVPDDATVCFYCGAALTPVQNAVQMPQSPAQNMNAGINMGYGQPGMQQPNQQMYNGMPMQGYAMPQQSAMANFGKAFKNAPGEFAGKVKRMGISMFCLLGIIAAMLFIVAPFMNFASIHVNERVEVPSYYSSLFGDSRGTDTKIKAGIGLNLFELSQLSGTVGRLVKNLTGGSDTGEIADMVEQAESYITEELEDELDTEIRSSSIKETFGTVRLILKGHAAALVTPWALIICGIGLLVFSVINNRKLKLLFSLIPLVFLIWLIACSGHFFDIMGIGAWTIIIGIILGVISALKEA